MSVLRAKHKHQLIVPTWTPYFESDAGMGTVNYAAIPVMARKLAKAGADIVWVNGTSGESVLLNKEERMNVAEHWKQAITNQKLALKLYVNVGCECLKDTIDLARHAQSIGSDGVASMGPSFFKPKDVEDLVAFLKKVAEAASAVDFYYYHFPAMNGISFPLASILKEATNVIPNLKGAKVTDVDMEGFDWALHIFESDKSFSELQLFSGFPTLALTGFFQGAAGGFVYDFMVKPFSDMIFAYEKGDIASAQKLQIKIGNCYRHVLANGGMAAAKYLSDWVVVKNGGVRLPLKNISESQKKGVHLVIEEFKDLLFDPEERSKL